MALRLVRAGDREAGPRVREPAPGVRDIGRIALGVALMGVMVVAPPLFRMWSDAAQGSGPNTPRAPR